MESMPTDGSVMEQGSMNQDGGEDHRKVIEESSNWEFSHQSPIRTSPTGKELVVSPVESPWENGVQLVNKGNTWLRMQPRGTSYCMNQRRGVFLPGSDGMKLTVLDIPILGCSQRSEGVGDNVVEGWR